MPGFAVTHTSAKQNKAFDTLFNKRDYAAAERFWSDRYIQHSAHIPPGRDGLFSLVRSLPSTLRYEIASFSAKGTKARSICRDFRVQVFKPPGSFIEIP